MQVLCGTLTLPQTRQQWNLFNDVQHNGHVGVIGPLCRINGVNLNVCLQELQWPTLSTRHNYLNVSMMHDILHGQYNSLKISDYCVFNTSCTPAHSSSFFWPQSKINLHRYSFLWKLHSYGTLYCTLYWLLICQSFIVPYISFLLYLILLYDCTFCFVFALSSCMYLCFVVFASVYVFVLCYMFREALMCRLCLLGCHPVFFDKSNK